MVGNRLERIAKIHLSERTQRESEPIPGYRLVRFLGRGGAGEVWEAEAPGGIIKAVKITLMDLSDDTLTRREIEGLQRIRAIRHPYLLAIDRYELVDGLLVIVMEMADKSLFDRWAECRDAGRHGIPRAELLDYLHETAEVLDKLNYEHGLQHLDIKPTNILISSGHVKVADFGLLQANDADLTHSTLAVSLGYSPPELLYGRIDKSADQYALAVTYLELLTGHRPYESSSIVDHITKLNDTDPNLSGVDAGERAVLQKALNVEPSLRFANCMELVEALSDTEGFSKSMPRLAPSIKPQRAVDPGKTQVAGGPPVTSDAFMTAQTRVSKGIDRSIDTQAIGPARDGDWPMMATVSLKPAKARPHFVKGQKPKSPNERPTVEEKQPPEKLFPSPTSAALLSEARVDPETGPITSADEFHDTFLAVLPVEIYAYKLRGFLQAFGPEIVTCSERETIVGFLKRRWNPFSQKTGIFVRIETIQHTPSSDMRLVDVAVWNTSARFKTAQFGQTATMLIRLVKAYLMANESLPAQTFDIARIKQALWQ